jgi:hypothetical protein
MNVTLWILQLLAVVFAATGTTKVSLPRDVESDCPISPSQRAPRGTRRWPA